MTGTAAQKAAHKIAGFVVHDPNLTVGVSGDGKYVEIIPMTSHRFLQRFTAKEAEIWLSGYVSGFQRPKEATVES